MRIFQNFPHLSATVAFIAAFSLGHCSAAHAETGIASWYGQNHNGRLTANGEVHDSTQPTAAHLRLPFGSWVKVTNPRTGTSVVVRVNDRGPYVKGRIIDLSERAARDLGMLEQGLTRVSLKVLTAGEPL